MRDYRSRETGSCHTFCFPACLRQSGRCSCTQDSFVMVVAAGHQPSLPPSLKLRRSKKASEVKESFGLRPTKPEVKESFGLRPTKSEVKESFGLRPTKSEVKEGFGGQRKLRLPKRATARKKLQYTLTVFWFRLTLVPRHCASTHFVTFFIS